MKRVIRAFGVLSSPLNISQDLLALNISHSVASNTLMSPLRDTHCSDKQPAWPVVLPSIKFVSRYRCTQKPQILFICDSLAQLSLCNLDILKPQDMRFSLQRALDYALANPDPDWQLKISEPSYDSYVKIATKPSWLNDLQTALYKIVPYDLRKEVQIQTIAYLAGVGSKKTLMAKLNSSYKLERIKELVLSPKCTGLKDAVAEYTRTGDVDTVALQTGFATFEILYLSKSAAKSRG